MQPRLFRPLETRNIVQVRASTHGRKCFLLNRFSLGVVVWMNGSQVKVANGVNGIPCELPQQLTNMLQP